MTTVQRRLVGVGVGPGAPDLVTVRALRVLAAADAVLVPATERAGDAAGRAETIVVAACPEAAPRIRRVPFSMADAAGVTERRRAAWAASADEAVAAFDAGATTVAFATIGDPSVYSTFSYLAAEVTSWLGADAVAIEVVPGVTAMQALAAASRTPLVEGDEVLALVPLKGGIDRYAALAEVADTVCVYKAGRHLGALRDHVLKRGVDAIVGQDVGLPTERIRSIGEVEAPAPYFSTVLSAPRRGETGGRL